MKWMPDTCGCSFECQIDQDGVDLDWISTYTTCDIHSALSGQPLLAQVLSENRAKNLAQGN
jgi:hypothetical protein